MVITIMAKRTVTIYPASKALGSDSRMHGFGVAFLWRQFVPELIFRVQHSTRSRMGIPPFPSVFTSRYCEFWDCWKICHLLHRKMYWGVGCKTNHFLSGKGLRVKNSRREKLIKDQTVQSRRVSLGIRLNSRMLFVTRFTPSDTA